MSDDNQEFDVWEFFANLPQEPKRPVAEGYKSAFSVLDELPTLDEAMQLSQNLIEAHDFEVGEIVLLNITEPPMRVVIANEPMFWGRIAIHQITDRDGKKHGPQLVEIGWLSKVSCDNEE